MKAKTLESRIQKHLTTKTGSIAVKYELAMELIRKPYNVMHPVSWSFGKGHANLLGVSKLHNAMEALDKLGIDYDWGNDAPRGGRAGDYIRLTEKGQSKVKDYNLKLNEKLMLQKAAEIAEREENERILNEKLENYKNIIPRIDGEKYKETATRLSNALGVKIDGGLFHAIIKNIRIS